MVSSVWASASGTPSSSPMSATPPERMSSEAPRIRSRAASTRLSRATSTGTTTSNRIALPIHQSTMATSSSAGVGVVGKEEAAEHPTQGHAHRTHTDRKAACRSRTLDLIGRQAPLDGTDPDLHVRCEVPHEHGGDVGDHPSAVLGRSTRELEVLNDVDLRATPGRRQVRRDQHGGLAAAFLVGSGSIDDDAFGCLVAFDDPRRPGELELDWTHPDADPAEVLLLALLIGDSVRQLRSGKARRHLRDVVEELPDLVQ